MFEGYGGPVNVNKTDAAGIDPTLESCCQREVNLHTYIYIIHTYIHICIYTCNTNTLHTGTSYCHKSVCHFIRYCSARPNFLFILFIHLYFRLKATGNRMQSRQLFEGMIA